jgi:uncharacterized membrane protein YkvA (DUF1232 family)
MAYSDQKFLAKMKRFGAKAGERLVEQAFILWYTLRDPNTPTQAKLTIGGALAYWILPADLVPDFLPAVGFVDDLAAITAAIRTVVMHITPDTKAKAKERTVALLQNEQPELPRDYPRD